MVIVVNRSCSFPRPSRYGAKAFDGVTPLAVKAAHGELTIKAEEDGGEPGRIIGYGSKFGLVDSYGETVLPGAFKKSLRAWKKSGRPIPMLWQHRSDAPIGVWDEYEEDETGLKLGGQLNLETQRGKEAWSDVKMKAVGGLSIGYYEIQADAWGLENDEPRRLKELDLRETSVVTFPALREAQIDAVKAALQRGEPITERNFERFLREQLRLSRSAAAAITRGGLRAWTQGDLDADADRPGPLDMDLRSIRDVLSKPLDLPAL